MAIDMKKCWEKGAPGCKDCLVACHTTHNVPDIGTRKEEIKWIWEEKYENVFQARKWNGTRSDKRKALHSSL